MEEPSRNPSSPHDGRAYGPPSQSLIPNSSSEALAEASIREPDGSELKRAKGDEPISVSPSSEAFMSNSFELGCTVDCKMEKVSLIGCSDDLLSDPSAPVADGEGGRKEFGNGVPNGDDESGATETDNSERDESSSEESDSSSTSSEEEEEEDGNSDGDGGQGLEEVPAGSDDEEQVVRGPIKSKNELEVENLTLQVLPSVPQVKITLKPHHQTIPVGMISSVNLRFLHQQHVFVNCLLQVLGNRVIVEGSVNHNPLNEGSLLWITETRTLLGIIDEIFGPVKKPYYVVRYNSESDVPTGITDGTAVSFVIEFANHILDKNICNKGYDASGENDEEFTNEVEFSDDEKEAEYRRSVRPAKRGPDDRKHVKLKNDTHKKRTNFKGARVQKCMVSPIPDDLEAPKQPIPGVRGPFLAPSRACKSDFGKSSSLQSAYTCENASPMLPMIARADNFVVTSPSHQLTQQPNPSLGHGVSCLQQPNAFLACGMPMLFQQQQNALWPLATPTQQQTNAIFTHGMSLQQQQVAAMAGFQMNCLPSQQLGTGAYLRQHQIQGFSDNSNRVPPQQQIFPMLGIPGIPWIGGSLNYSTGLMPPVPVPQAGQASLVHTEQGVSDQLFPATDQGGMLFNPGSSSVRGRTPLQRGGRHSFRPGMRR
ncbi:hypothetical protein GW17_00000302 [Ensete ventricosum]|nr:hypothetical protein GW17_00000302 [Ensete ventricosum]